MRKKVSIKSFCKDDLQKLEYTLKSRLVELFPNATVECIYCSYSYDESLGDIVEACYDASDDEIKNAEHILGRSLNL